MNQQNVPRADNDYFKIRNLYKAENGNVLLFCDKAGFELRIMAWLSGDSNLIISFNSTDLREQNIHKKTAMRFTKKDYDAVTRVERDSAKSANFLICYGGSSRALQTTLLKLGIRMSRTDCQKLLDAVFETYPGIKEFQIKVAQEAAETGYSETIYGFKRLLPSINSSNNSDRRSDERRAANTPDQGSAAEIMKRDQNLMYERTGEDTYQYFEMIDSGQDPEDLDHGGPLMVHGKVSMNAQIHDEIIFEIVDDVKRVQMVDEWVRDIMGRSPIEGFPVPMVGESSVGYRWGSKMSVEKWLEDKQCQKN
jgi:DNA polymerase-1